MKKLLLFALPIFVFVAAGAQVSPAKWQANFDPQKLFIENLGQFDNGNELAQGKVLFVTDGSSNVILFTKNGLTYKFEKFEIKEKEQRESYRDAYKLIGKEDDNLGGEEDEATADGGLAAVHMQWIGANPDAKLVPVDEASSYFTYGSKKGKVDHARGFSKLIYKNLYPNIDVEYEFNRVEGIEYSLILHPGADISLVKMQYTGADNIVMNEKGEIHIPTIYGDIIDHAPSSFYAQDKGSGIASSFTCEHKQVRFTLDDYDHNQEVVIDPWTTTPALPHSQKAFYIKSDSSGNAYVYGGDSPFKLLKYNTSGVLQWTYNTPWDSSEHWFGALATDRAGNSYITNGDGATLAKISPAGALVWSKTSENPPLLNMEFWCMDFNCDQTQLYIGGMRGPGIIPIGTWYGALYQMNLTTGAISNYIETAFEDVQFIIADPNETRSMCMSPNGNIYFMTLDTIGSATQSFTFNFRQTHSYNFDYYLPYSAGGTGQGSNNMRATSQYIYTTNGVTLDKRDATTGNILTTVTIPGGSTQLNSGVAIDSCGNVYVGSQNKVVKYDANLNQITTASTSGAVYDVSIGINGDVLACGQSFAAALAMGACPQVEPICYTVLSASLQQTPPACAGQCTGTASATPVNGTGPYKYLWNNSDTSQTISNLCAGTYTVTITDQSTGNSATATTTITAPSAIVPNATAQAATCGNSNGSASVTATGGSGSYTYLWSNNSTSATISNLSPGNYTVTVTGTGSCTATASVSVSSTTGINLTPAAIATTCGNNNGSASVSASGGGGSYTYSWSNNGTGASITNVAAGTYTVTVSGGGCTATASASVASSTGVSISTSTTSAGCTANGTATATATGGNSSFTYLWSNNGTTSTISNLAGGTYSVTVSGNGCSATASATVGTSGGGFSLSSSTTPASCGGSTGSATVTPSGSGSYTYSWSNNGTSQTINNLPAGTYTVTVTGGGCSATASINVTTTGGLSVTPSVTATTCGNNNGGASLNITGGNGTYSYIWSNNATTQNISNVAAGNYTVTVTGTGGCSGTASVNIAASTGITLTLNAVNTTCGNNNGSASVTVSGGSGSYTYNWSNNSSASGITNLAAGIYQVTVNDLSGCSSTGSVTINPSGGNSVVISPSAQTICAGDSATVCAPSGYVSYEWNTGDTSACITTSYAGNYYLTVTDNGGCTATSNHASIANYTPTPVTISVNGDTLTSYSAITYQWYLNGQPIQGATSQTYIAVQTGNYAVEITDNNGCHYTSSVTTVKVTAINDISNAGSIRVYPNPLGSGYWHIEITEDLLGSVCEIFDAGGRLVYKDELRSLQSEIAPNIAQGVYMLQIHSAKANYNMKLIKLY